MRKIFAVFGNPVLHSKSPQLFRAMIGAEDEYVRIRPQSADDILRIVKSLRVAGASVTSPYKESLLPLLDDVTAPAKAVGAVNCIRNENGRICGHNTDYLGVTGALEEAGMVLEDARILVLGAGGAARAAIYGLTRAGSKVFVSNRTMAKAEELSDSFGAACIDWENPGTMPFFDAIVSALLPGGIPPFAGYLSYGKLLDAVYKPSRMSDFSRSRGTTVIPGDRWLIYQGLAAARFYVYDEHASGQAGAPDIKKLQPDVKRMEKRLQESLQPDNLRIAVLDEQTAGHHIEPHNDLMVSGFGLDDHSIKNIINEEKHLAFGG
jgi:shikimate dehydrogenase